MIDFVKSMLDLHENPLMNYIVEIKRLRVIKTSGYNNGKRLRFTILDEENRAFLYTEGNTFCCFRWRHFDMSIKDHSRLPLVEIRKDFGELETGCFCGIFCPNKASVELIANNCSLLGSIRENCSSLFASYSYHDDKDKILARLEGPLIVSGLMGIGQLDWLQPQIVFKLMDTGGKQFGKITRQWRSSLLLIPDSYEIEYSGWLSPRLRLLILGSIFMIVSSHQCV